MKKFTPIKEGKVREIYDAGDSLHLRKSNTEPIIRIYSEGKSEAEAEIGRAHV